MKYVDEAYRAHTVQLLSSTNVGERVYGAHAEQGVSPKVNFYHIATINLPGETMDGGDGLARIIIQNSIFADTKVECRDIMNLIMDDWKIRSGGWNRRTIGNATYTIDVEFSKVSTRQVVFDPELKCYHGIVDIMINYREG